MKKITRWISITSLLMGTLCAEDKLPKKWQFSIGLEGGHYKYKEPNLMQLLGGMGGMNATVTYRGMDSLFQSIETRILFGKANYSSRSTGKLNSVSQFLAEIRGLLGYSKVFEIGTLSPYTGIGYRYKSDGRNNDRSTTGHLSYKRQSNYLYVPLGVQYETSFTKEWGIRVRGEYDHLIYGVQLSDGILKQPSSRHPQYSGFGIKTQIEGIKRMKNNDLIKAGPYLHYWSIEDSEIKERSLGPTMKVESLEPKNITYEVGLSISYHF